MPDIDIILISPKVLGAKLVYKATHHSCCVKRPFGANLDSGM